jgi:hypothetical protein
MRLRPPERTQRIVALDKSHTSAWCNACPQLEALVGKAGRCFGGVNLYSNPDKFGLPVATDAVGECLERI